MAGTQAPLPTKRPLKTFLTSLQKLNENTQMNLKTYLRTNPTVLGRLLSRDLTNKELAKDLGYSVVYVSQVLKEMGLKKVKGQVADKRKKRSVLKQTRSEYRTEVARDVLNKRITIDTGAKIAKCSERTLYRYIKKLEEQADADKRSLKQAVDPQDR